MTEIIEMGISDSNGMLGFIGNDGRFHSTGKRYIDFFEGVHEVECSNCHKNIYVKKKEFPPFLCCTDCEKEYRERIEMEMDLEESSRRVRIREEAENKKLEEERKKLEEEERRRKAQLEIVEEQKRQKAITEFYKNKKLSKKDEHIFDKLFEQHRINREDYGVLFDLLAHIEPYIFDGSGLIEGLRDLLGKEIGNKTQFQKQMEFMSANSSKLISPNRDYKDLSEEFSESVGLLSRISCKIMALVISTLNDFGWNEKESDEFSDESEDITKGEEPEEKIEEEEAEI